MSDHPAMNNYMIIFHSNINMNHALQCLKTYFNLSIEISYYHWISKKCCVTWIHLLPNNVNLPNNTSGEIVVPVELASYVDKIIYSSPTLLA